MPKPNTGGGEGAEGAEETTPTADQFGVTLNPDGSEVSQAETVSEEKEEEGKEVKKDKDGNVIETKKETEKSAEVVALEAKITEYSTNLSGQNTIIAELKQKITDIEEGKGKKEEGDVEPMFKDIKFSKDLTAEEREDMTDTEIKLFDQNAQQQVAMNTMFEAIQKNGQTVEDGKAEAEASKVEDLNSSAKTEASRVAEEAIKTNPELAKDSRELADKIIVEFNEFNNDGITQEKLVERMKKALNNVSGYTPPKEEENKGKGSAVKDGKGSKTDPHGIDAIVEGVNKKNDGDYSL